MLLFLSLQLMFAAVHNQEFNNNPLSMLHIHYSIIMSKQKFITHAWRLCSLSGKNFKHSQHQYYRFDRKTVITFSTILIFNFCSSGKRYAYNEKLLTILFKPKLCYIMYQIKDNIQGNTLKVITVHIHDVMKL